MLTPTEISCLLVPLGILAAQVLVLIGLGSAFRRPARPLPAQLARYFGIWLVVAPGLELVFYGNLVCGLTGYGGDPVLRFMQEYGGFCIAAAWVFLAVPMSVLLVAPARLVRRRAALAVPAAMALLAAVLSASHVASLAGEVAARGGLGQLLRGHWATIGSMIALSVIALLVTAVPLLAMILLIVHSVRARRAAQASTKGNAT